MQQIKSGFQYKSSGHVLNNTQSFEFLKLKIVTGREGNRLLNLDGADVIGHLSVVYGT